jgi:peptide chain release factor 3
METQPLTPLLAQEIAKRRTFAIISHPDAGKTTLTEKLLLFGGAIHQAGVVKGKRQSKKATSDWMEIEKKRGISVTSTVLQFDYQGYHINLLDTPGHEDFSEDTYRTLTAADSAVMLIDAAKGIEPQTLKLFQVCRMRHIPIFTFINKLDRDSREPFDLLQEIETVLGIRTYPMNWPWGMGQEFHGVYDRLTRHLERYSRGVQPSPTLSSENDVPSAIVEDLTLLDEAGEAFDPLAIASGELTPVFFGSALTNFGVQLFLDQFLTLAPPPGPQQTDHGSVAADTPFFSGFIFKIQANMNPQHRDRVAFLRVGTGRFERGMTVRHLRLGRAITLAQPQNFFAQERAIVDEAYPGDIIGLFDPGSFRIGDTLSERDQFIYAPLPQFSPEHFVAVTVADTLKHKQFHKGLQQLSEEGAVQIFRVVNRTEDIVLGFVGRLQFEVFEYRMQTEYGATFMKTFLPYAHARWVSTDDPTKIQHSHTTSLVRDIDSRLVMLFPDEFAVRWTQEKNPDLQWYPTSYRPREDASTEA